MRNHVYVYALVHSVAYLVIADFHTKYNIVVHNANKITKVISRKRLAHGWITSFFEFSIIYLRMSCALIASWSYSAVYSSYMTVRCEASFNIELRRLWKCKDCLLLSCGSNFLTNSVQKHTDHRHTLCSICIVLWI